MIEKIILDYLDRKLTESVYMERPENPPESYVLIEKTGSGKRNQIYTATLAIQSYAPTLIGAATLNEAVKTAMYDAVSEKEICKVSLNSDYNFTDTAMMAYRYQAVFDITHY